LASRFKFLDKTRHMLMNRMHSLHLAVIQEKLWVN